ncbi:DUF924 family protein [Shewanella sedimentimangrovi]|uniref:DUF924 domain-containing protein n=1 Tax=Shewanella sedimentimangrovi TaxID=2814293 RepID=A0ABX7R1Z1_9GAMM|nr:DUF924 family protein [Shewanella sedimentimangrovi]QSX37844.1 DUF924 domain-containing protein [Shewanella sedimentimangrovi]
MSTSLPPQAEAVLHFWFVEISPKQWWAKDPGFDDLIRSRFGALLESAVRGELFSWRASAEGRLAEVLVLDQFSRNIHRDTPAAFAADPIALVLAQEAVAQQADRRLPDKWLAFLYMPFMHSESALIHETAMTLFDQDATRSNLDFERRHKAIIDRFGRYPHRNAILGRISTEEELAFLAQPVSSF